METVLFGARGLGESGLVSGWSRPEEEHVWNDGEESLLQLVVPQVPGGLTLIVEALPFITAKTPAQDVTLFVNGRRSEFWRLTQAKIYYLEFEVPPEFFFRRPEGIVLNLTWLLPNSVSPKTLEMGADARELGLCFRSVTVKS